MLETGGKQHLSSFLPCQDDAGLQIFLGVGTVVQKRRKRKGSSNSLKHPQILAGDYCLSPAPSPTQITWKTLSVLLP